MEVRPRLTPAIANARRAVRERFDAPEMKTAKRVLLAVSGGPDSLALALAANFELPKLGIELSAVIVDHNLQQDSSKIADQAKARLLEMGIKEVAVVSIQVPESGQGPEAAARDARYEALENCEALSVRITFSPLTPWMTRLKPCCLVSPEARA
jgi:Predicted ATPase of the PP-loop superfamily implicated in cell cycle control